MGRERILFLCVHNSARSQMAAAWLRSLAADRFEVDSVGIARRDALHPLAIRVMAERGIHIGGQVPKLALGLMRDRWDHVITVSDEAYERCPPFPTTTSRLHWPFPDPTVDAGSDDERIAVFRMVRDSIEARVRAWLGGQGVRLPATTSSFL